MSASKKYSARAENNQNIINLQSIFYTDNRVVALSTSPLPHEYQNEHEMHVQLAEKYNHDDFTQIESCTMISGSFLASI